MSELPTRPADVLDLDDTPRRRDDLASVELDGETVMYDERTGELHTLNRTATVVWGCLDGSTTLRQLVEDIAQAFAVEPAAVAGDLMELVRSLGRQGLLEGVTAEPGVVDEAQRRDGETQEGSS